MSTDYIIISSIDWTTHWQMHQQLAKALVSNGKRVLFIENTGARGPKIGDVSRIRERISNWFKSTHGFTDIEKNLTIYSCLFIPLPYSKIAVFINNILISNAIKKWMRIVNFNSPVVITFLPTPLAHSLIKEFDPVLLIYYCANNMSEALPDMKKLGPWEEELFKKSDLVFSISEEIRERALVLAKHVYSYPAGVDFSLFENAKVNTIIPEDLNTLPRPIVGYVGALSGVLDQKLIIEMAKQMPSVTFALIVFNVVACVVRLYNSIPFVNIYPMKNAIMATQGDDITVSSPPVPTGNVENGITSLQTSPNFALNGLNDLPSNTALNPKLSIEANIGVKIK